MWCTHVRAGGCLQAQRRRRRRRRRRIPPFRNT
jgi:hypothetical protein